MRRLDGDRFSGAADPRVHYRDMDRPFREVTVTGRQRERSGANVAGWNLVREIDDRGLRGNARDDALHRADEPIMRAEVRGQGDDSHAEELHGGAERLSKESAGFLRAEEAPERFARWILWHRSNSSLSGVGGAIYLTDE